MALFGRKKPGDDPEKNVNGGGDGSGGGPEPQYQPDKAKRFFDHARTMHDAQNFEYAMQLWLNGLKQDPTSMAAMEGFFQSAAGYLGVSSKKNLSKETARMFTGREPLEKFLRSLLDWGMEPLDGASAVRAAEGAAALGLAEQTYWIGERALGAVGREKRPRKDLFVRLKDAFTKIGAYEMAVRAGEAAVSLDPSDGQLSAEVRNLAAQSAMSRGGFDQTGQAGGFRANIRDAEKQRQLEEAERIVKTEETVDRLVRAAEEDYKSRPEDPAAINTFIKRLLERGRPEDEKLAFRIANDGFEKTKQFRFRQTAGDIRLRAAKRKLLEFKDAAEGNPGNATAQENYRKAQLSFLKMEIDEYRARIEAYPTDLLLKYELGKRLMDAGQYDDAIALFQDAQNDPKRRVDSLSYLGQAFLKKEWLDEAVHTFRQALDVHRNPTDEAGMELRYGLMTALQAQAKATRDLAAAEEADRLASSIAIQQINFKDIRTRRDELKKLVAELRNGGTS